MKAIVASVVVVFAILILYTIVRLWRDVGRGASLFHWSPTGWEHEESPSDLSKKDKSDAQRRIEGENSIP